MTHSEAVVASQLGLGAGPGERSELLREHHVALDLHLARHECLHALQLARRERDLVRVRVRVRARARVKVRVRIRVRVRVRVRVTAI